MRRALLWAAVLLLPGCGSDLAAPDPPPSPAATRDGRWVQDVDYMTAQLERLHPDLFFATSRTDFLAAAADLKDAIPRLQDHEVVIGLMRLAALPGDAHTSVMPWAGFHRLPLRLAWLDDGLYVVAAEAGSPALGARLVAAGDVPVADLQAGAARLVSHENDAWLRAQVPDLLAVPEVLFALRATDTATGARLWLRPPNGALEALDIGARTPPPALVDLTTAAGFTLPLHQQRPEENYWSSELPGSAAVYVQYNRCRQGGEPFGTFADRILRLIDQGRVERLIVDVRHNGGGDSSVDDPLINGLESRGGWRRRGRLFCLIDSGTFSSAVWTAHDLQRLGAVLVGGPTGGKPNAYGDVRILVLPNSRLDVGYSTRYFRLVEGSDPPSLMPDVPASVTIDDVRTGRDPLLEAALRFTP